MNLLKGPQRFTEIMGFSERGVQEYFQKFFQDEQLFRKTYKSLKANESLLTACSVPLLCWMVCFCLKKHFTGSDHVMRELKTTTSIYVHFVFTLLEHHDQSQSVLTMLRSLGQLAEEGMKKQEVIFNGKRVATAGLDQTTSVFLYKDSLKIKDKQEPVFRFMHFSFQEFFTALSYVLLDKEHSWWKISEWVEWGNTIYRPSSERSNPFPSVMMFLCGLLNEEHCSHIRDLDLTYCDLTTEKLKILQPALCMCESIRLNISKPESSGLNLHPLPVCQSCVHIVDSEYQWVQVEPSVFTDEGGSEFRISTPAGRFECSRTKMRWVCAGDVTFQYRAVDGRFLRAELERLQCERIGPVTDVTVISRKLEEAHLPHYACLPESDPSLKNDARLLSKSHEGISVELTRYHSKIVQPSFSLITLILSWFIKWEEHCDLLFFMRCKDPLFLHIYFFPVHDTCSKEKVEQNEKSSLLIRHPRPDRPFQLKTPHLLEVPGATRRGDFI
ncbi:hypothetical protein QQF64_015487 [Cirrhinus molitorella]|uniref:FIIND domain-containing protein n=1 Tax=Cirrhinus molitorella TaxID=172907 RepID=A0ABR3NVU6_9TELE